MREMINKISILTIALIIGISTMTACSSATKANTENKVSTGGTEQSDFAANDRGNAENKATDKPAEETSKDGMPSLKSGDDYKKIVRGKILKAGWKPARSENAALCGSAETVCDEYPEYEMCRPNGDCEFRWQKNGKIVLISTVGEPFKYGSYAFIKEDSARDNSSDIVGKYVYRYTDEGGGEVAFDIQMGNVAVMKTTTDDLIEEGQGSWNWDGAKGLLTVNLPSVKSTFAADETYPTFSKRTIVLKKVDKNLTIVKIIPASTGGTGGIFKKL